MAVPAHAKRADAGSSQAQASPPPTVPAPIKLVSQRLTKRGLKVRMTIPLRTPEGIARGRVWTSNMGLLLGQRRIIVLQGTRSRTFYIPLNRRGKRMLRRGVFFRLTARVPAPPPR
jgi:hypothetical protein